MTNKPTISVVIPTYNRAHLVTRAVRSALSESGPGDEVIIVDDGSTDDTEKVLEPYRGRIRYFRINNSGAGTARNHGIAKAGKELVAFLDSDDEWMSGKLELHRRLFVERPDILFSFTDFAITTPEGEKVRHYLQHWHNDPRSWDEILAEGLPFSSIAPLPDGRPNFKVHIGNMYVQMAKAPYIFTSTVVVRREEAGEALFYEEDIPLYEDWLCFGRLSLKGPAAYLDTETAWQHAHGSPRLTDANRLCAAETRLLVLERLWGRDPDFMREHGDLYDSLVDEQHRLRAAALISLGRTREAREVLRTVTNAPVLYRMLAALPGSIAHELLRVRRTIRRLLKRD